jgi:uncharacterized protein DUF3606
MRGRRHDSIALPGGRRVNDPDTPGTRVAVLAPETTEGVMADDLKQTGKPDDTRINVDQDHEVGYWAKELGVSREQLREAVQQAGPIVEDVRRHLTAQQAAQAIPAGRYLG